MKKILFGFLVALSLMAVQGAEASMDSGLFLFSDDHEIFMVATGIWADDLTDSAAISNRLRYPLMKAIKNKLNKGESPASVHSTMAFISEVKHSATISFFKSASTERDEALIVLSRHDGARAIPYGNFSAKASELLAKDDVALCKWIDEAADRIVAGWRLSE